MSVRVSSARSWLDKLLALSLKESKQMLRDPSSWLIAFVLPGIFLMFFGFAISLDANTLRLALIDQSGGVLSRDLSLAFAQSPHFSIHAASSRAQAAGMMADSAVQGVLVLPSRFDSLLASGQDSAAQLMVDGSEPNTAAFIRAYAEALIQTWITKRQAASGRAVSAPVILEPVFWYNNTAQSRWALVPGSITIVMTLIGTLLTSLVITREWERGTMEALFASPASRMHIFLSKLFPYYCLSMFSMILCALAGVLLFQVPFRGSAAALFLLSSAFLMPALGQGLLISSVFRSQLPAAMVGFLSSVLPSFILSGLLFDINSMPWPIQWLTKIIPASYMNVSLQTLFLAGDLWPLLLRNMARMAALGLLFFLLCCRNLRKRLD